MIRQTRTSSPVLSVFFSFVLVCLRIIICPTEQYVGNSPGQGGHVYKSKL